ncbi:MAG: glycosyltransferase family 2 protein [Nanoarchaeota archaeon]|nr:glycosyltransferase family 2 protein [Nanoarchaeota archaeon]
MKPLITVAIVNWNGKEYLKECLNGVFTQTYPRYEVVLLDNGSTDGSVAFVKKFFPKVRVIENETNQGIAKATNQVFTVAKGEYIASLHNDAVPDSHWLDEFHKAMQMHDKRVVCIEGAVHHHGNVGVINGSLNLLCFNTKDVFRNEENKFYSGTCSMFIKRGSLPEYCDSDYFFYSEDVSLGWKLRLLGYTIKRAPKAIVLHEGTSSVTNPLISNYFQYLGERNRFLNFLLYFERRSIAALLPAQLLVTSLLLWKRALSRRKSVTPLLRAYGWLLTHPRTVMKKRREIQRMRKVPDERILPWLSCRVVPEGVPGGKIVDRLIQASFKVFDVPCVERCR